MTYNNTVKSGIRLRPKGKPTTSRPQLHIVETRKSLLKEENNFQTNMPLIMCVFSPNCCEFPQKAFGSVFVTRLGAPMLPVLLVFLLLL